MKVKQTEVKGEEISNWLMLGVAFFGTGIISSFVGLLAYYISAPIFAILGLEDYRLTAFVLLTLGLFIIMFLSAIIKFISDEYITF